MPLSLMPLAFSAVTFSLLSRHFLRFIFALIFAAFRGFAGLRLMP